MTLGTSTAIHHQRPSPLSKYMQHLQQKNNNKNKPSMIQPIKSGTAAAAIQQQRGQLQRGTSDGTVVRNNYSSAQRYHHHQQQQQQQENNNNNNNNSRLPVWKERQLRAQLQDASNSSSNSSTSNTHQPPPGRSSSGGAARLAMTIQNNNSNGSCFPPEIRRVPFYPHENHPALADKQQPHPHHADQQQQQHQHHHHDQQLRGCDPTSTMLLMSGTATYVSNSSTDTSSEDARSSTTTTTTTDDGSHHTDRTPEQEDQQQQQQLVLSSSMAIVPFTPQEDAALVVLDAILENDDINTESLYQELICVRNSGSEDGTEQEPQETDIDTLTKMIDDCAARWQNSARVPSSRRRTSSSHRQLLVIANNNNSYDAAAAAPGNVVPPTPLLSRKEEVIMAQQRAEIKYLRARLASSQDDDSVDDDDDPFESVVTPPYLQQQQQHYHHHAAAGMLSSPLPPHQQPPPVEQIDSVPIEHIEVAILDHDGDLCSVTSGLTNLVDLSSRMPDDATAVSYFLEKSFSRGRPDAESSVCGSVQRHNNKRQGADGVGAHHQTSSQQQQQQQQQQQPDEQERVTDQPLLLRAADGSSRQALYTGPVQNRTNHNTTGLTMTTTPIYTGNHAVLKFVETGDTYMGQVCNGEMHGQGTYTFAKHKKKRPHGKVLRGQFQNNVYVGWNPEAAFLE
jgi:hypothetical protein